MSQQCTLRPTGSRLIVRPDKLPETTPGGIALPARSVQPGDVWAGEVLATGPGVRLQDGRRSPIEVGRGDRVHFARHAGGQIEFAGEKLRILDESEILMFEAPA